jgi:very-short-patch-repair endonuclease
MFYSKTTLKEGVNLYSPKPLMTDNEKEFFGRLTGALPLHFVFPQVSFSALLNANVKGDRSRHYSVRGTFAQKIADYVICDKNLNVVAIVELDDKTHRAQNDAKRDAMLEQAGYVVIRWNSKMKPAASEISEKIIAMQSAPKSQKLSGELIPA